MIKTIPAILILSMAGVHCLSADIAYQFSVDTSALNSQAAFLDFQLNPGGLTSPAVTAVISDLATNGSFAANDIVLTGDAGGSFSNAVTLNNTDVYNDAFQSIQLGSSLSFLATFSGPGIDTPGNPGTFFGFSIYDSTGTVPLLTTSPDGTIAGINADALDGVQPFTNSAGANGQSVATVAVTPEPQSYLLPELSIAAFIAICLLRRSTRRSN